MALVHFYQVVSAIAAVMLVIVLIYEHRLRKTGAED